MGNIEQEENYNNAFEIVKCEYQNALNRFRDLESKLNMLLVFLASILAGLLVIVNFINKSSKGLYIASLVCLVLAFIFLIVTFSFLIDGLFPRKHIMFDIDVFQHKTTYKEDKIDFMGQNISCFVECVNKLNDICRRKSRDVKCSILFLILLFGMICVLTVLILAM